MENSRVCPVLAWRTEKSQLFMKSEGYLRRATEWSMRARQDLVWWATSWEGVGGTHFGEGNTIGNGAMVGCAAGSILGGGFTLGSGTTLLGGRRGWPCTGRMGTGRGRDGTGSGVGGDRVVDGIQLDKRSRILEMAESCSWWKAEGMCFMAHNRKLSA